MNSNTKDSMEKDPKTEEEKQTDDLFKNYISNLQESEQIIDPALFSLPDMGDYMGDEFSIEYLQHLNENIGEEGEEITDSMFYLEKPYSTDLGYNEDGNVLIIKASPNINEVNTRTNAYDGDTLYFQIPSISDGNDSFYLGGKDYSSPKDYIMRTKGIDSVDRKYKGSNKPDIFGIRFLGVDCPEVPKFMEIPKSKVIKTTTISESELGSLNNKYNYEINDIEGRRNGNVTFVQTEKNGDWFELASEYTDEDLEIIRICIKDPSPKNMEYAKQAKECQTVIKDTLSQAEDMRILMDLNTVSLSGSVPPEYSSNFFVDSNKEKLSKWVDAAQKAWDGITGYRANMYAGYNAFGMDNYRRFLGAIYVKKGGEWINLGKYVATKANLVELLPDYSNDPANESIYDYKSDVFRMWSYDRNTSIVDELKNFGEIDDRKRIQEAIFGRPYEELEKWTVSIGDCMFMVPPTSIKLMNSSVSEKAPLLRSKGSAVKSAKKDSRLLQLDLFFNEDRGINGYPVNNAMPGLKENEVGSLDNINYTYYMNGLRPLISMFKFTPFLPIENSYINRNLGIDAVSLISLNVQSVPNMPKVLKATLILQEFDYRVYMPEIPIPDLSNGEDAYTNLFSKTINYEVMRYYYQRPIIKGERIVDYPMNSKSYLMETLGDNTALQPMRFTNPYIKFYQLDKNFLARKHQAYMERERRGLRQLHKPTKEELDYKQNHLGPLAKDIDGNFRALIDDFNESEKLTQGEMGKKISMMFERHPELYDVKIRNKKLETNDGKVTVPYPSIMFKLDPQGIRAAEMEKMLKNYAEELNVPKDSFKDGVIKFPFSVSIDENTGKPYYYLDNSSPGIALLGLILQQLSNGDYLTQGESQQEDLEESNRHTDKETPLSLEYVEVPTPPIIVTGYNVSMANTFNNLSLQMSSGYAPQYLGGQDIRLNIDIETSDIETVTFLSNLPREVAMTCREYREVLTVYPIRIDTEFTRFFGINEVIIEDVVVDTQNGFNGQLKNHWKITLSLMAVDRTLRNRETLKNISRNKTENEVESLGTESEETGNRPPSGGTSTENRVDREQKNFWNLKGMLAEAEVYPDLELPTLYELERNGFKFIRYSKTTSNRIFPDPDFYFYYGHVMMNHILRSSIQTFLGEEFATSQESLTYELVDSSGSRVQIQYNDETPESYEVVDMNENYKKIIEASEELNSVKINSERISHKNRSIQKMYEQMKYKTAVFRGVTDAVMGPTWHVSDNIQVRFREPYLLNKELATEQSKGEIYDKLQAQTQEAIAAIDEYLNTKPENVTNDSYHETLKDSKIEPFVLSSGVEDSYKSSKKVWKDFRKTACYEKIQDILNIRKISIYDSPAHTNTLKNAERFDEIMPAVIASMAASRTGLYEFEGNDMANWSVQKSVSDFLFKTTKKGWQQESQGYCLMNGMSQDLSSSKRAITFKEAIDSGYVFGPFGIEQYDKADIERITGEQVPYGKSSYFIDPYYRNSASEEEIKSLKCYLISHNEVGATIAFRELMFWVKKMLEEEHMLTMFDVIQREAIQGLENIALDRSITLDDENYINKESTYDKYAKKRSEQYRDLGKHPGFWSKFKKKVSIGAGSLWDTSKHAGSWVINTIADSVTYMGHTIKLTTDTKFGGEEMSEEERLQITQNMTDSEKISAEKDALKEEAKIRKQDAINMLENMNENLEALKTGKFFIAGLLAATNGSEKIYESIRRRDYETLNAFTKNIAINLSGDESYDDETWRIRKYVRALAGYEVMANPERIGEIGRSTQQDIVNMAMSRVYLKAAEQPVLYLQHSFYDMIVNDKRGRMLRAFPTFYMLFIDEGREIGFWKLHDNFYNMSSISSYQIVKSRKIAADTATIEMNNMFQTFDRHDDDLKDDDEYTCKDFITSIFSPRVYYLKEEVKRSQQEEINRAELVPGIRTHIRMGYGANASTLPIVFNGCITDVQQGDVINLVAQGDGMELTNPLSIDTDAEDVQYMERIPGWKGLSNLFTSGATPKTILSSLLLSEGGFMKSSVKKVTKGRLFNNNPFGIVHFGDPHFNNIFPEGEPIQNIYEATSKPQWGEKGRSGMAEAYSMKDAPKISIELFDKTFWDVMHICASTSPDFVAGIRPFQFRSSIFMGRPRYYCGYDYEKREDGQIIEKRKPFQQYHILTSYSDIIDNNLTATEKGVATCAVGVYDRKGWGGTRTEGKTLPLWVDINIYPEKQKTMNVDLGLMAKPTPEGSIVPGIAYFQNKIADTKGRYQGGQELAFRMTANNLKNNLKDMYRGDIIILGDPSINPNDRIHVVDLYERITGAMEVEAVIHSFSIQTGFISHVYPDLISAVDDPHENMNTNFVNNVMGKGMGVYLAIVMQSQAYAGNTLPLMTVAAGMLKNQINAGTDAINIFSRLLNKNDVSADEVLKKIADVENMLNLPTMASAIEAIVGSKGFLELKKLANKPININNVNKIKNVVGYHNKVIRSIDSTDTANLISEVRKYADLGHIDNPDEIISLIEKFDKQKSKVIRNSLGKTLTGSDFKEIKKSVEYIEGTLETMEDIKKVEKIQKVIDGFSTVHGINNTSDYKKLVDMLELIGSMGDEIPNHEEMLNVAKEITKKINDSGAIKKIAQSLDDSDEMQDALKMLDKVKYAAAGANLPVTIAIMILEYIVVNLAFGTITSHLARVMRSHQVLQVFPVKKGGKVYTAGMNGTKGVVVGSPMYNDRGLIQKFIGGLYDYDEWDGIGKIVPFVINLVSSEGMQEAASKYKKREGIEPAESVQNTELANKAMQYLAAEEVRKQNAYHGALITPRILNYKTKENKLTEQGKMWFHRSGVLSTEAIEKNKHISNSTMPLVKFDFLREAIEEGLLVIAHDTAEDSVNRTFTISGERISLNCIEKNDTIDIPVLREDAIYLLAEIVRKVRESLKPNTPGYEKRVKKHPIIVQSCLVAGAKNLSCTGLNFTFTSTENKNIETTLNNIITEQRKIFNTKSFGEMKYFSYEQKNNSPYSYKIEVYPPYSIDGLNENLESV